MLIISISLNNSITVVGWTIYIYVYIYDGKICVNVCTCSQKSIQYYI